MEKLFFVELGMGADLHGQDITEAAIRAVKNAIHYNSMPGITSLLPQGDVNKMKVNVRLAVPCDKEKLDVERVKSFLPYGQVKVEVIDGGMLTTSGIILTDKQDKNDLIYVVNAAVEVGY